MEQKKPLVLMLAHSYYPNDPRIRREAEALIAAGFRVRAVSLSSGDARSERWSCNGVEVVETGLVKERASLLRYGVEYVNTCKFSRREVWRLLAENDVSLVQVHTLPDFLVWSASPARRVGVPVLLDLHESMPDFFVSKYGSSLFGAKLLSKVLQGLERWCAGHADDLLTVNDEIADTFRERLGRVPTVVMNTVDESLFSWTREKVLWPTGPKKLSYHGTLTSIYGLHLLLEALPAVLEVFPGTKVEIFGDGPARSGLELLAREKSLESVVVFRGCVLLDEMSMHLQTVHLGVVPTTRDEFLDMSVGTKLLEYVYLGIPVVTSNLKAVERLFGGSESVVLFEGNSSDSLARAIMEVLGKPEDRVQELVDNAKTVYRQIAWPIMAEKYVQLVRRMIEEREE